MKVLLWSTAIMCENDQNLHITVLLVGHTLVLAPQEVNSEGSFSGFLSQNVMLEDTLHALPALLIPLSLRAAAFWSEIGQT